jgi:PKD repeat protein
MVRQGNYTESLHITTSCILTGELPGNTVLSVDGKNTIITVQADNVIISNLCLSHAKYGIVINDSTACQIVDAIIRENDIGIVITSNSNHNHMFRNSFVGNTAHVGVNTANFWNDSSEGNYWDDYTGVDADHDGIGDTPYQINGTTLVDMYPLMEPITDTPTALFSYSPTALTIEDSISFTDLSTDADGLITSWYWEFGDGTTSMLQHPIHSYKKSGNFTVNLTVSDIAGAYASVSQTLSVDNLAPTAAFSYTPLQPTDIELVSFTDESVDLDGSIVNWTWTFGHEANSTEQHPLYRFKNNTQHLIILTVEDNKGSQDSISQHITVLNVAPTASFTFHFPNVTARINEPISFYDTSNDPDGDIISHEWIFGDGTNATGKQATHTYQQKGTYHISLIVTDDDGVSTMKTQYITVTSSVDQDDVITGFSLFDMVFVVFLIGMVIIVIYLSKKFG